MDFESAKLFSILKVPFKDTSFIAARSGFSKQGGFEIYVENAKYAEDIWDTFLKLKSLNVAAGCLLDRKIRQDYFLMAMI